MAECPYVGLVPFEEKHATYFFGRDAERRIIADNLRASKLTLLHGASGVGKTSVLQAGVANDLEGHPDYVVVLFRRWWDDPVLGIHAALRKKLGKEEPASYAGNLVSRLKTELTSVGKTLLLILDQFEDHFQYEAQNVDFAAEFPRLVFQMELPVHVLISIREDWLAALDRFKKPIPGLFDNRLSVEFLSREGAWEAILGPIDKFNKIEKPDRPIALAESDGNRAESDDQKRDAADKVVDLIIAAQSEEKKLVQTPYLQLVMERWWKCETDLGSPVMRESTLTVDLGGVRKIFDDHVKDNVERLSPQEQEVCAAIFKFMVTPAGRKIALTVTELCGSTELEQPAVEGVLEALAKERIASSVPAPRSSSPHERCFEFTHDVVAKAALEWRKQFRQADELAKAKSRAEEATRRAEEQERLAEMERQLSFKANRLAEESTRRAEAERQRAEEQRRLAEAEQLLARKAELLAEQERQRAQEQARQAKRFRCLTTALAFITILVIVAGVLVWRATKLTAQSEIKAERLKAAGDRASAAYNEATTLQNNGDLPHALAKFKDAAEFYATAGDQRYEAEALYIAGLIENNLHKYAEARKDLADARQIYHRNGDGANEAKTLVSLADVARAERDFETAETSLLKAIQLYGQIPVPMKSNPFVADATARLAELYAEEGKYDKAEASCEQAIAQFEPIKGPNGQELVPVLRSCADTLRKQNKPGEADKMEIRARKILANP